MRSFRFPVMLLSISVVLAGCAAVPEPPRAEGKWSQKLFDNEVAHCTANISKAFDLATYKLDEPGKFCPPMISPRFQASLRQNAVSGTIRTPASGRINP